MTLPSDFDRPFRGRLLPEETLFDVQNAKGFPTAQTPCGMAILSTAPYKNVGAPTFSFWNHTGVAA
jgi:hypothetical protein